MRAAATPLGDARAAAVDAGPAPHPWDAAAEAWDRHSPLIGEWLRDATAAMLAAAHVTPGARVLDIAAGAGDQTIAVAGCVGPTGEVLATDISPRILALAAERARRGGFGQVGTKVADAQALGLAGAGFDAAVCRLGLMFCESPLAALRSAFDALAPGGRYAALVFSAPAGNPCLAITASTARRHAGLAPADPFAAGTLMSLGRPGALAALLAEAGFVDTEVRALAAPMRLASAQAYVDFVRAAAQPIKALLAALSVEAQNAAWHDITQQLDCFSTATGWVGPNELLIGSARRPLIDATRPSIHVITEGIS